jgi:hypothetical protein
MIAYATHATALAGSSSDSARDLLDFKSARALAFAQQTVKK